jgi:hypothetical protein
MKHYTLKTYVEVEVTAPRIVNFGSRMRRIVSYTPPATLQAEKKNADTHWLDGLHGQSEDCK